MRATSGVRVRSAMLYMMQAGGMCVQRRTRRGRTQAGIILALCVLVSLALVGCRSSRSTASQPVLPGGIYRSDAFHFTVTYPAGWQANITPAAQASQGIPLHVIITRTDSVQTNSSLVSNCSITILNTRDRNIAQAVEPLKTRIQKKDEHLHSVTIGGMAGYQEDLVRQEIPDTQLTDTHTTYYLFLDQYVYEISTEAISSDNADAALQSIVASFTILK